VEEPARLTQRRQTGLAEATGKRAAGVTALRGASARSSLAALMAGEPEPAVWAEWARGRLRSTREVLAQAVVGRFTAPPACLSPAPLRPLDDVEEALERVRAASGRRLAAEQAARELLAPSPGVGQRAAEIILAEVGPALARLPTATHVASWAGRCPGTQESGGKRLRGKPRHGTPWLRQVRIEVAHGASRTQAPSLAVPYRRLAPRRGKQRALVARGHSLLVMVYYSLSRRVP
jgi:transposase